MCSECGIVLNADINGAFNIMKKVFKLFDVKGLLLTPKITYM